MAVNGMVLSRTVECGCRQLEGSRLAQQSEDGFVPTGWPDAGSSNKIREHHIRIIGAVRPLHENRLIDRLKHRKIIETVTKTDGLQRGGVPTESIQ